MQPLQPLNNEQPSVMPGATAPPPPPYVVPQSTTYPPPPVLVGQTYSLPAGLATMPDAVRDARILNIVGCVLWSLFILAGLINVTILAGRGRMEAIGSAFGSFLIYGTLLGINAWLVGALKNRNPNAWSAQRMLSILGLFQLPIGTVLHIMLLTKWSKPDVKAWFGVQ